MMSFIYGLGLGSKSTRYNLIFNFSHTYLRGVESNISPKIILVPNYYINHLEYTT